MRVICSIIHASTETLDHILSHDTCDVDPQNRITRSTPLHLAVSTEYEDDEDGEVQLFLVESLLEAGADVTCV